MLLDFGKASIIGKIKFTYRKESEKYLTSINRSGAQSRTKVSSFENFDLDISKQLPLKYTNILISFSGKNLNNQTQSKESVSSNFTTAPLQRLQEKGHAGEWGFDPLPHRESLHAPRTRDKIERGCAHPTPRSK